MFITSNFYCTQCGGKSVPLQRRGGQQRELGHLKKLYCISCQKEVNHVEVREDSYDYTVEDFLFEFNSNNFNAEGLREKTFRQLKASVALTKSEER